MVDVTRRLTIVHAGRRRRVSSEFTTTGTGMTVRVRSLARGFKYVERRNSYGVPCLVVVYAPSPWDRLVLRTQRAWRSWRRPR